MYGTEGYEYEVVQTDDMLAELVTRIHRLDIHPSRLAPSAGEGRRSLAVLSGYMKDRDLKGARTYFAAGVEERMKKINGDQAS